jgi:DNA-binding transcriptional LysR family regulator
MAMTLDQLRTFRAVAAVKSFRGATEVLHITQPAVSKQIQALEAELNERLFERGKSAQLTSAGTALLKHAEHLSRILTVAKEEITDLRELRAGHLSIGAAHSYSTSYVLRLIFSALSASFSPLRCNDCLATVGPLYSEQ